MKNSVKKAIAILSAAALLCSSAAAYAAQITAAPADSVITAPATNEQPVSISLPGHGVYGNNAKLQYSVVRNAAFDIKKTEYSVKIEVQKNNPSTDPSGWWSIVNESYHASDNNYAIWAGYLNGFDPQYDKLRTSLSVRVTLGSGEVIVVTSDPVYIY